MKLYTREQLLNTIKSIRHYDDVYDEKVANERIEKHLKALAPIELPSDEEIEEEAPFGISTFGFEQGQYQGFIVGAKWIKEQINNLNK